MSQPGATNEMVLYQQPPNQTAQYTPQMASANRLMAPASPQPASATQLMASASPQPASATQPMALALPQQV